MAFLLLAGTAGVRAQQCDVPQIGAQVFVEPGQTPEDIDGFFRLLHDNGMKVARIRMFGAHMYRGGTNTASGFSPRCFPSPTS